jgi:hypothetical protein
MNIKLTEQNIESLGRPIIENIIAAHSKSNYDQVTLHFTDELKETLLPSEFEDVIRNHLGALGKATSISYLGYLIKNDSFQLLWKVKYEKGDEDILWQMYLTELNEVTKVDGIRFE